MIDSTSMSKKFDENNTFKAYDIKNVYKGDTSNISQIIEQIRHSNISEKCLIQIPNTVGLTHDIINSLPDNVDVRIVGGYTEEYAKSFSTPYMDFFREKATYSRDELNNIISKIETIESNIVPNWNKYERALYLYEYMKNDIVYREPNELNDGRNMARTRTWDTLTGLTNQLSTCNGYSHIYTELCTRQGIDCCQVAGKYDSMNGNNYGGGGHAWNIITIDGKNFPVDIIWDSIEKEKGIDQTTNFGNIDIRRYKNVKCNIEKQNNLSTISKDWVEKTKEKVSKNIPKEKIVQEKIEQFLKSRDQDRKRMMELREKMIQQQILQDNTIQTFNNAESYGGKSL